MLLFEIYYKNRRYLFASFDVLLVIMYMQDKIKSSNINHDSIIMFSMSGGLVCGCTYVHNLHVGLVISARKSNFIF